MGRELHKIKSIDMSIKYMSWSIFSFFVLIKSYQDAKNIFKKKKKTLITFGPFSFVLFCFVLLFIFYFSCYFLVHIYKKKGKSRALHTLVFFSSFSIEKIMEKTPPPPPNKEINRKGMHQIIWEQIRKGLGL